MEDPADAGMLNLGQGDKAADSLLPIYTLTQLSPVGFWAQTVIDMYLSPQQLKGCTCVSTRNHESLPVQ